MIFAELTTHRRASLFDQGQRGAWQTGLLLLYLLDGTEFLTETDLVPAAASKIVWVILARLLLPEERFGDRVFLTLKLGTELWMWKSRLCKVVVKIVA